MHSRISKSSAVALVRTMVVAVMEYIEQNLGHWILTDPEFTDRYDVVSCSAKASDHLDGFMAKILMCDLVLKKKADET